MNLSSVKPPLSLFEIDQLSSVSKRQSISKLVIKRTLEYWLIGSSPTELVQHPASWFGYIASLAYGSGEEEGFFTCFNPLYLPSRRLATGGNGGRHHPVKRTTPPPPPRDRLCSLAYYGEAMRITIENCNFGFFLRWLAFFLLASTVWYLL